MFEKMMKDAAVTFLMSLRPLNEKRHRERESEGESQSSDFIQMSLSAYQAIFEYHNRICISPAVD